MCKVSDSSRKRHRAAYLAPARAVLPQLLGPAVDEETATRLEVQHQETGPSDTSSSSSSEVSFTASPTLRFLAWLAIFGILYQGVVNYLVVLLIVVAVACWFYDVEVRLVRSLRPATSRTRPGRAVTQARVEDQLIIEDTLLVDV
jgi:hypothetical protein